MDNFFPVRYLSLVQDALRINRVHEHHRNRKIIQPRTLQKLKARISPVKMEKFLVCLFFTVLIAQVLHSRKQSLLSDSEAKLSYFPEVVGDCLSACRFHIPPSSILERAPNAEEIEFFSKHAPELINIACGEAKPEEFCADIWRSCQDWVNEMYSITQANL